MALKTMPVKEGEKIISERLMRMLYDSISNLDADRIHSIAAPMEKLHISYYPPGSRKLSKIIVEVKVHEG